ncbi:MAG: MarR family transcriptional regulator [Euryarchaeota archaeon]|nr:MarR family transcriptional regulator [Euryarchaeota archaeon]
MVTLYGTLGFTPEKFYPSIRHRGDVADIVLFHDGHADSEKARSAVAKYCSELDIPFESVAVDAFDLIDSATRIQGVVRKRGQEDAVFNVTGGTKVLTAAAILTCILEGMPAVYIHETTGEEIPLPLITVAYKRLLSDKQRQVLEHVAAHPGCTQAELREALGVTKPTISHHVQGLVDHRLLDERRDPKDARRKRLHLVPSARLLLGGPPD